MSDGDRSGYFHIPDRYIDVKILTKGSFKLPKYIWEINFKSCSFLQITLANGKQQPLRDLFPPKDQVYLLPDITVLSDVQCNLGTANCRGVKEPWAVLTDTPLSLQTFQLYGRRFGGTRAALQRL